MKIRRIEQKDREAYMNMTARFYKSTAVLHDIDESNREATFNEITRFNEKTGGSPYADCFIFELEGKIIGYALLAKTFSQEAGGLTVWIEELMIEREYRGKGYGTEFFDFLKANIPAKRYRLEVEDDNASAIRLYERMGFCNLPYLQYIIDR